jgi:uncharacterized membrane protein SpoIIM required for sporulation
VSFKERLGESIDTARRMKSLIIFFAIVHVVFLFFGQWMVAKGVPGVLYLREEQLKALEQFIYIKPLTGPLATSLILKIFYTTFFNLVFGALISTTVLGVVFFFPYIIAVWRGFIIGVLFYGLDPSPFKSAVFYGTFLLEFTAYSISSAAGMDLGLGLIWPHRKGKETRKEAVLASISDCKKLYLLVFLILALAAAWEIGWLHYLGPFIKPPTVD